jgi:hypothetical protein
MCYEAGYLVSWNDELENRKVTSPIKINTSLEHALHLDGQPPAVE